MNILATDIGYGDVKFAYMKEGKLVRKKFPTAVARVTGRDSFGEGFMGTSASTIEYMKKHYMVGEEALNYPERLIPTRTPDFNITYSPLILYFIFKRENVRPEAISISLSIAEFKSKKEEIKKVCSKFFVNGEYFEQEVVVFPQGIGIWKKAGSPQNAIIIDIGHNTVDVLAIKNGKPDRELSFGIDNMGTSMIATEIRNYIMKRFNELITEHEAKEILAKGKFMLYRKEIPLEEIIEELKKEYSDQVFNSILQHTGLREFFKRAEKVILAGGGAYFFSKEVQEKYGIEIPESPEFANTEGFFQLLSEFKRS